MANINQPAPGTPDKDDEVYLVSEDWDTSTGVAIHRQLFSDGSRRTVRDGVEEHSPTLSDWEKANSGASSDSVQAAEENDEPLTGPQAEQLNAVAAAHGVSTDEALARQKGKTLDEDGNEVDPEPVPADPTIAATILSMHGAGASGDLNEIGSQAEPGEEVEPPQGYDEPVLGEDWEQPSTEAQLAGVPKASDSTADDAAVQQDKLGGESDGPDEYEHNEARDNLEALNDEADEPLAKPAEGSVNNSDSDDDDGFIEDVEDEAKKLWKSVKDFEFKTVQELKDFAAEHNINLHGATKKDDIVDAIKTEDKHDA